MLWYENTKIISDEGKVFMNRKEKDNLHNKFQHNVGFVSGVTVASTCIHTYKYDKTLILIKQPKPFIVLLTLSMNYNF